MEHDIPATHDFQRTMRIVPLTPGHAEDICTWTYPAPYECYNMTDATPANLLDPDAGFHALLLGDELVGFRSFGADGQVPGYRYDANALDTGGGLRPALTGRGWGRIAIATGLSYGVDKFGPKAFRVTVALFNERALRTVETLGFQRQGEFVSTNDARPYAVLTLPADRVPT